jgi:hypothetical protein
LGSIILAFALAAPLFAEGPRIVFTKSFPGSVPPYVEIAVEKDGEAYYNDEPKGENPVKFHVGAADAAAMFDLAAKLSYFSKPLESGLKVAFMGRKTFRYEGDGAPKEATFNYSEDLEAKNLLDWFERISETERYLFDLERAVRFDKLGVNAAVLRIEAARDQKRLVADDQFLPLLDRVVKNENFMHMARTRAAALAESIRGKVGQ